MPCCLIKIKDRYFEWSTVSDSPVTRGMTEEELRQYVKRRYGEEGLSELPRRLARVEATGTSSFIDESLDDLLQLNRAGRNETTLTADQIYRRYAQSGRWREEKARK